MLSPVPGALAIQDYLADTTWLNRSGSPETFAPLVRKPDVLFQVAFGDQTVPNPTAYTLLDAGGLFTRAALYRNDRTPQRGINPHGFLLDGLNFPTALRQGQLQEATFLLAGATIDPDGAKNVWEVPVTNPAVLKPLIVRVCGEDYGPAAGVKAAGMSEKALAEHEASPARGLPQVQRFELPVSELAQVAQGSGLQWVNSDAEKIAAVQAAIAAEPKAVHRPRERAPAVAVDDGPLVLVETKRDLREVKLPFEQQGTPPLQ